MPSIQDRISGFSIGTSSFNSLKERSFSISGNAGSTFPSIHGTDLFDDKEFIWFLGFSAFLLAIFITCVVLRCCGVLKDGPGTREVTPYEKKTEAAKDKNPYKPLENTEAAKHTKPSEPLENPLWKSSHTAYWVPNSTFPPQQQYACFAASPVITYPTMVQPVAAAPVNLLQSPPPYPIDPIAAQVTMPTASPSY